MSSEKGKEMEKRKGKESKKKDEEADESPEDIQLRGEVALLVERIQDPDAGVQKLALETLRKEIRTATSSMTSVPKPLKFLRPHFDILKDFFAANKSFSNRAMLADILSVLAMTMGEHGMRESLNYKLSGSVDDLEAWGHEYVRNLAGEIGEEYTHRVTEDESTEDLDALVDYIVPFHMSHNAEPDACDLLMEIGQPERLVKAVDVSNSQQYTRVCNYLIACAMYFPEPEDALLLKTSLDIYRQAKVYPDALRMALKLGDQQAIQGIFEECQDKDIRKQLAFIVARNVMKLGLEKAGSDEDESTALSEIMGNCKLSELFHMVAESLSIAEPKDPDSIFKGGQIETRTSTSFGANVDSARQNLATTFVNAFANAGSGKDVLMTVEGLQSGNKWLYKNKDQGMLSAAASLGMIMLWDVDEGLPMLDKYLYSAESYVKAGALFGIGLVNCNVRNVCDPAKALLEEDVSSSDPYIRIGAALGLGLSYAGTAREDITDILLPLLEETSKHEVLSMVALSLGLIFVSSAHGPTSEAIIAVLMENSEALSSSPFVRFISLALGLIYLGKGDSAEVALETARTLPGALGQYTALTIETCAYAGTGNVLKVQRLVQVCGEQSDAPTGGSEATLSPMAAAVLGMGVVAMGEDIGAEMISRTFNHLLQYGDPPVRRAVPVAIGLISACHPEVTILDTLSKLSHDSDQQVAMNAIFAIGLVAAGTNNTRAGQMLHHLAAYYYKEPGLLFVTRLGQGLLHLGKGTLTINPFFADRLLMNHPAVAGLLVVCEACLDMKNTILGKCHYLLFTLALAMYPRFLVTLDSKLEAVRTSARVGQAVDTVGQAGRPKSITGFQTHTTPVLVGHGDRAELATDDYIALNTILEGFVIVKPADSDSTGVPSTSTS